jgi:mRNA interferase MazF
MTRFEFGDVVLVPFPFTDQSNTKKRPAVVVSSAAYNAERPDLIILAITSQVRAGDHFDAPVRDWRGTGLLKPSVIKPVIATIERGLVIRQMGRLSPNDQQALVKLMRAMLGE